MSLLRALKLNRRQRRLRKLGENIDEPAIATLYGQMHFKFSDPFRQTQFLATDLEMTGLDANKDHIVSIGFVPIIDGNIVLGEAQHILVAGDNEVGESATVHHIRDQDLQGGASLPAALNVFFKALQGKVMLAHHAPLDLAFLDAACQRYFNSVLKLPVVDTLQLEHRRLLARQQPIKEGDLRLFNCRRRYHLPDMPNHNALTDALSTAELFLAITAHKGRASEVKLADLVSL